VGRDKRYRQCFIDLTFRWRMTQSIMTTSVCDFGFRLFIIDEYYIILYTYYVLRAFVIICVPVGVAKLRRLYVHLTRHHVVRLGIFDHRISNRIRIKIQSGFNRNFFFFVSSISPYAYILLYMRITQHAHTTNAFTYICACRRYRY